VNIRVNRIYVLSNHVILTTPTTLAKPLKALGIIKWIGDAKSLPATALRLDRVNALFLDKFAFGADGHVKGEYLGGSV